VVSLVEQVAIVGSAWSTAGIKEVAKLLRAELQGCGRVALLREWITGALAIPDIKDHSHFET